MTAISLSQALGGTGFVDLWHPYLAVSIAVLEALYLAAAAGPLRRRFPGSSAVEAWRVACFMSGLALIYLCVGTPLDTLADGYLFSAHMVEHSVFAYALPPLILAGTPPWLIRPMMHFGPTRWGVMWLVRPVAAMMVFTAVFSLAHAPGMMEITLHNEKIHFLDHAAIIVTSLAMWWPVLSPLPELPRLPEPAQLLYLGLCVTAMTILFALVTFSPVPLYPTYASAPRLWGISALADQRAGSMIMHFGSFLAYGVAFIRVFFRWARSEAATFAIDPALRAAEAHMASAGARSDGR